MRLSPILIIKILRPSLGLAVGLALLGPTTGRRLGAEPVPSVEERLSALEERLEQTNLGRATRVYASEQGLGPAASGVYHAEPGLAFGGYGEIQYVNFKSEYRADQTDLTRFILYAGYRFNSWIVFNSEIEYEHAGAEGSAIASEADTGSGTVRQESFNEAGAIIEMAYLDFEFRPEARLALGLNLVPIGITNYKHEPTTFASVRRPQTETFVIPTTWREHGAILHGELFAAALRYRAGVMTGLRAQDFDNANWIRAGRSNGSETRSEGLAALVNLEFTGIEGLVIGGTYYAGSAGQNEIAKADFANTRLPYEEFFGNDVIGRLAADGIRAGKTANVTVFLTEAHIEYQNGPYYLRALAARGWMSEEDARAVNRATGFNVGRAAEGAYAEIGFDLLSLIQSRYRLFAYVRNEYVNTQKETVTRYAGGEDDLNDVICAAVRFCRVSGDLARGNRDLGVIESFDPAQELYGVRGVADRASDRRIVSGGFAFYPEERIVLKIDYERANSSSDYGGDIEARNVFNNKIDRINLGLGFIF